MAERQLQVTQLNSSARAMDTYVRPELEKNARAIGLLLNSIDKTDNDRAIKNAEIEAVTEALSEGPKDLHNRVGFSSTRPDYIATRLENRGQQFARESLPKLESDFQEFLLGSNDNGTDIEPYLKEQFGSLMSSMEGGGGSQFLIAGASDILVAAKADMQKRHMEYIDKRAMDETMTHLSMRVDGIVHQKITNDEMGQPLPPQAFNDRIKAMDSLAVDMSQTTPLTKGQANKAVFESLLAMAAGNDPENAERYIHMAKLVRYAKGKNGELRPEAFEAIAMAEDAAARKINSKNIAEAAALKEKQDKDKVVASASLIKHLTETEGAVVSLAPEQQQMLAAAGITVERQNAMMDATNKMKAGGQESQTQAENWVQLSLNLAANRQNPEMGSSYSQFMNMVSEQQIHPSRLKEAIAMFKGIEQAAPLINNLLNTQPRNAWVASIVKMEEGEYDIVGLTKREQLITEWNNEMNKLIGLHYDGASTDNMAPTTSQLQSMADHVKGLMANNYADEIAERELTAQGFRDYKIGIQDAIDASEVRESDGKLNLLGPIIPFLDTTIAGSGESTFSGSHSANYINNNIDPQQRIDALYNPMGEYTIEDATNPDGSVNEAKKSFVGMTHSAIFDAHWGPTAFARYYKQFGPDRVTEAQWKRTVE